MNNLGGYNSVKMGNYGGQNIPNFTNIDFTGQYKDKLMTGPKQNMPHMKRIINQQVFLEESDPYVYEDGRRNYNAIEAAS